MIFYLSSTASWPQSSCGGAGLNAIAGPTVETSLDLCPLPTIRRYFRKVKHLMEAYHQGYGYKLAAFAHQKFKTHRFLPENRMDEIIAEMKALKMTMDAPAVTTTGDAPSTAHDAAVVIGDDVVDEGEEYWAMCSTCSKYRKLCNPFPSDQEFTCGHELCEAECTEECDCDDDCEKECPCSD